MRGVGELAVVERLPGSVVDLFGVLTHLGDPWLVLGVLALLYVVADRLGVERRRVAFVLAVGFAALGVTLALKSAFALPRPPGAFESGYGFPSGHALGAAAVWGAATAVASLGTRRVRVVLATGVAAVVALSRVVIGVHYLADVVAGVAVGLGLLGVALWVGPRRESTGELSHAAVDRVFALAAAACLLALVVAATPDALVGVGASVGGWWGWRLAEPTISEPSARLPRAGTAVCIAGLPVVLGGLVAVDTAAAALPGVVTMGTTAVCVGALFALPRVAARVVAWVG